MCDLEKVGVREVVQEPLGPPPAIIYYCVESASIAKPLQNWQHAQTPWAYLGEIWHAILGQWSLFTGLCHLDWCTVSPMQGKSIEMSQFLHFGEGWALIPIPFTSQSHIGQETVDPRPMLTRDISLNPFIVSPSGDEKPQF